MKLKTIYICTNCKYESPKWVGMCPECKSWNNFVEDTINVGKDDTAQIISNARIHQPITLNTKTIQAEKIKTNIKELDNVLGGGFVKGSLTVFSGEPGIGKSTLTLQICNEISKQNKKVFYISGEESIEQISLRAERLKINSENLSIINETNLESIIATLKEHHPDIAVIDSIQVVSSDLQDSISGSISQVKFIAEQLMRIAKSDGITIILIGHVTKDGVLAGPKVLEHLVDTVLQLEGDRYHEFRMLRTFKNRFGSTSEIGIFEMTEKGMIEVANPSSRFIESRKENAIGSCLSAALDGDRAFIIEVQALSNVSAFGYPKRIGNGFDTNRLDILIAVLQKHAGINLANQDIFINIVGGLKIKDPAVDLAVCLAIISSFTKKSIPSNLVAIGEIGLCGEVRKINQMEKRKKEVEKMGLKMIEIKKEVKEYREII